MSSWHRHGQQPRQRSPPSQDTSTGDAAHYSEVDQIYSPPCFIPSRSPNMSSFSSAGAVPSVTSAAAPTIANTAEGAQGPLPERSYGSPSPLHHDTPRPPPHQESSANGAATDHRTSSAEAALRRTRLAQRRAVLLRNRRILVASSDSDSGVDIFPVATPHVSRTWEHWRLSEGTAYTAELTPSVDDSEDDDEDEEEAALTPLFHSPPHRSHCQASRPSLTSPTFHVPGEEGTVASPSLSTTRHGDDVSRQRGSESLSTDSCVRCSRTRAAFPRSLQASGAGGGLPRFVACVSSSEEVLGQGEEEWPALFSDEEEEATARVRSSAWRGFPGSPEPLEEGVRPWLPRFSAYMEAPGLPHVLVSYTPACVRPPIGPAHEEALCVRLPYTETAPSTFSSLSAEAVHDRVIGGRGAGRHASYRDPFSEGERSQSGTPSRMADPQSDETGAPPRQSPERAAQTLVHWLKQAISRLPIDIEGALSDEEQRAGTPGVLSFLSELEEALRSLCGSLNLLHPASSPLPKTSAPRELAGPTANTTLADSLAAHHMRVRTPPPRAPPSPSWTTTTDTAVTKAHHDNTSSSCGCSTSTPKHGHARWTSTTALAAPGTMSSVTLLSDASTTSQWRKAATPRENPIRTTSFPSTGRRPYRFLALFEPLAIFLTHPLVMRTWADAMFAPRSTDGCVPTEHQACCAACLRCSIVSMAMQLLDALSLCTAERPTRSATPVSSSHLSLGRASSTAEVALETSPSLSAALPATERSPASFALQKDTTTTNPREKPTPLKLDSHGRRASLAATAGDSDASQVTEASAQNIFFVANQDEEIAWLPALCRTPGVLALLRLALSPQRSDNRRLLGAAAANHTVCILDTDTRVRALEILTRFAVAQAPSSSLAYQSGERDMEGEGDAAEPTRSHGQTIDMLRSQGMVALVAQQLDLPAFTLRGQPPAHRHGDAKTRFCGTHEGSEWVVSYLTRSLVAESLVHSSRCMSRLAVLAPDVRPYRFALDFLHAACRHPRVAASMSVAPELITPLMAVVTRSNCMRTKASKASTSPGRVGETVRSHSGRPLSFVVRHGHLLLQEEVDETHERSQDAPAGDGSSSHPSASVRAARAPQDMRAVPAEAFPVTDDITHSALRVLELIYKTASSAAVELVLSHSIGLVNSSEFDQTASTPLADGDPSPRTFVASLIARLNQALCERDMRTADVVVRVLTNLMKASGTPVTSPLSPVGTSQHSTEDSVWTTDSRITAARLLASPGFLPVLVSCLSTEADTNAAKEVVKSSLHALAQLPPLLFSAPQEKRQTENNKGKQRAPVGGPDTVGDLLLTHGVFPLCLMWLAGNAEKPTSATSSHDRDGVGGNRVNGLENKTNATGGPYALTAPSTLTFEAPLVYTPEPSPEPETATSHELDEDAPYGQDSSTGTALESSRGARVSSPVPSRHLEAQSRASMPFSPPTTTSGRARGLAVALRIRGEASGANRVSAQKPNAALATEPLTFPCPSQPRVVTPIQREAAALLYVLSSLAVAAHNRATDSATRDRAPAHNGCLAYLAANLAPAIRFLREVTCGGLRGVTLAPKPLHDVPTTTLGASSVGGTAIGGATPMQRLELQAATATLQSLALILEANLQSAGTAGDTPSPSVAACLQEVKQSRLLPLLAALGTNLCLTAEGTGLPDKALHLLETVLCAKGVTDADRLDLLCDITHEESTSLQDKDKPSHGSTPDRWEEVIRRCDQAASVQPGLATVDNFPAARGSPDAQRERMPDLLGDGNAAAPLTTARPWLRGGNIVGNGQEHRLTRQDVNHHLYGGDGSAPDIIARRTSCLDEPRDVLATIPPRGPVPERSLIRRLQRQKAQANGAPSSEKGGVPHAELDVSPLAFLINTLRPDDEGCCDAKEDRLGAALRRCSQSLRPEPRNPRGAAEGREAFTFLRQRLKLRVLRLLHNLLSKTPLEAARLCPLDFHLSTEEEWKRLDLDACGRRRCHAPGPNSLPSVHPLLLPSVADALLFSDVAQLVMADLQLAPAQSIAANGALEAMAFLRALVSVLRLSFPRSMSEARLPVPARAASQYPGGAEALFTRAVGSNNSDSGGGRGQQAAAEQDTGRFMGAVRQRVRDRLQRVMALRMGSTLLATVNLGATASERRKDTGPATSHVVPGSTNGTALFNAHARRSLEEPSVPPVFALPHFPRSNGVQLSHTPWMPATRDDGTAQPDRGAAQPFALQRAGEAGNRNAPTVPARSPSLHHPAPAATPMRQDLSGDATYGAPGSASGTPNTMTDRGPTLPRRRTGPVMRSLSDEDSVSDGDGGPVAVRRQTVVAMPPRRASIGEDSTESSVRAIVVHAAAREVSLASSTMAEGSGTPLQPTISSPHALPQQRLPVTSSNMSEAPVTVAAATQPEAERDQEGPVVATRLSLTPSVAVISQPERPVAPHRMPTGSNTVTGRARGLPRASQAPARPACLRVIEATMSAPEEPTPEVPSVAAAADAPLTPRPTASQQHSPQPRTVVEEDSRGEGEEVTAGTDPSSLARQFLVPSPTVTVAATPYTEPSRQPSDGEEASSTHRSRLPSPGDTGLVPSTALPSLSTRQLGSSVFIAHMSNRSQGVTEPAPTHPSSPPRAERGEDGTSSPAAAASSSGSQRVPVSVASPSSVVLSAAAHASPRSRELVVSTMSSTSAPRPRDALANGHSVGSPDNAPARDRAHLAGQPQTDAASGPGNVAGARVGAAAAPPPSHLSSVPSRTATVTAVRASSRSRDTASLTNGASHGAVHLSSGAERDAWTEEDTCRVFEAAAETLALLSRRWHGLATREEAAALRASASTRGGTTGCVESEGSEGAGRLHGREAPITRLAAAHTEAETPGEARAMLGDNAATRSTAQGREPADRACAVPRVTHEYPNEVTNAVLHQAQMRFSMLAPRVRVRPPGSQNSREDEDAATSARADRAHIVERTVTLEQLQRQREEQQRAAARTIAPSLHGARSDDAGLRPPFSYVLSHNVLGTSHPALVGTRRSPEEINEILRRLQTAPLEAHVRAFTDRETARRRRAAAQLSQWKREQLSWYDQSDWLPQPAWSKIRDRQENHRASGGGNLVSPPPSREAMASGSDPCPSRKRVEEQQYQNGMKSAKECILDQPSGAPSQVLHPHGNSSVPDLTLFPAAQLVRNLPPDPCTCTCSENKEVHASVVELLCCAKRLLLND